MNESIVEELCNKGVIDIKSGYCYTIARTFDGKLHCWGRNISGVIRNGREEYKFYKPEVNQFLNNKQIIHISCGYSHSLVLTIDGEVYGWGDNSFGQIGNRKSGGNECQLTPYFVDEFNGDKVKSIYCGSWHSLALTVRGRVYSWGFNGYKQLGRNTDKVDHSNCPKIIEISEEVNIEEISCGKDNSLLSSREGDLYVFGSNEWGELGIKTKSDEQLLPIRCNISHKFKTIASHYYYPFSTALSANGLYYIWGKCGEEEVLSEPKETQFESFNDIFSHYLGITY